MPRLTHPSRRLSKKLPERVREIGDAHPQARVELWAQDEMRLGLKPVLRRVWAPRGQRPKAPFRRRYEWLYLYGFVHHQSGEVRWLILPRVDAKVFSLALSHFAREVGCSKDKRILLVLDQAGWHTGKEVEVPEGIHLEFLPARSPELQPAERLWPLANEAVANRLFEDLDGLEEALVERCVALLEQSDLIRSHTLYHWWPDAA
jgi:transposase